MVETPVDGEIGVRAANPTDFLSDPADRLIAATAPAGHRLVTPRAVVGSSARMRAWPHRVTVGERTFWRWISEFDTPRGQERKLRTLVGEEIYERGFAAIRRHLAAP